MLRRTLSLPVLTFYGLGTMVGAGIYALAGKVAGTAGMLTPFAFLMSAILAGLTGYSYAQLSARFPRSGGEAVYVQEAFGWKGFSIFIGLMVCLSGIVSASAITHGFVGYFHVFFAAIPAWLIICLVIALMGLIAAWGIQESATVAVVITIAELVGLLFIIWIGRGQLEGTVDLLPTMIPLMGSTSDWQMIFAGAFLAFYAFIGFEDMVNVAEEVKDPERTLPLSIGISLVLASVLYCIVSVILVLSLDLNELTESGAPFALLYEKATGSPPVFITAISMLAIINGMLVQIIMSSRILYGMSGDGWLPKKLHSVHPRTNTPVCATAVVSLIILLLTLFFPISQLAKWTSGILLFVFACVNVSCFVMQRKDKSAFTKSIIPLLGCISTLGLLATKVAAVL